MPIQCGKAIFRHRAHCTTPASPDFEITEPYFFLNLFVTDI